MGRYHNIKETKKIGQHIEFLRKERGWDIEDISEMTGFSRSLIVNVENGANTTTSHLIEIAKAIGVQPKEILDFSFDLRPRYKLSVKRSTRKKITLKINKLLKEHKFFNEPRFVQQVHTALVEQFKTDADPVQISVILKRLVAKGELMFIKSGRKNLYVLTKKKHI